MNRWIFVLAATVTVAGCTSSVVERDFGKAKRQMVESQTYDPRVLTSPSADPVEGSHPDMLDRAVNGLRGRVSDPIDVKEDVERKLQDDKSN